MRPIRRTSGVIDDFSRNFVAMATRVGPITLFHSIGHPRKPPIRCKHLWPICHTSRVIGDFLSNVGESILGVRGPKSKIEQQRFVEGVTENERPKNGSIPSKNKKRRINLKFLQNSPNFVAMATNQNSKNNVL